MALRHWSPDLNKRIVTQIKLLLLTIISPVPEYITSQFDHFPPTNQLLNLFTTTSFIIQQLQECTSTISNHTILNIYTDGSVLHANTTNSKIGIGWIINDQSSQQLFSFSRSLAMYIGFIYQSMAIIFTLVTCPKNATINIFTNSQECIQTYSKFSSTTLLSKWRNLKINNKLIWDIKVNTIFLLNLLWLKHTITTLSTIVLIHLPNMKLIQITESLSTQNSQMFP